MYIWIYLEITQYERGRSLLIIDRTVYGTGTRLLDQPGGLYTDVVQLHAARASEWLGLPSALLAIRRGV